MTISPISSINLYSYAIGSYLYSFDNKQLQELMRQFNLVPTGNMQVDISRLENAIRMQQAALAQEENKNSVELKTDRPWIDIMWELGLEPNETIQEDYNEITDELTERISNAKDEEEYNKYADMYYEVEEYFNEYSTGADFSSSSLTMNTMIGLSQLALMNKMAL